ncbi:uncharacterized protein CDAR_17041 [Caerostris darwini]|uniref:Uncharacterized protein n=1 Tax=Caerostris darwini TaxID=1538125 RepID=A0AAV4PLM8_9ARAC|nr:uncharacterized protein CDAR_17041 [Caerostris darwini]
MVMDDVESLFRFIDPQIASDFNFIKGVLSAATTSDHRCSVPSCTDTTSGDDTSTLLDFFSNPTGRSPISAGNIRRKLYLSSSKTHTALRRP